MLSRTARRAACIAISFVVSLFVVAALRTTARAEILHFTIDTEKSQITATVDEPLRHFNGAADGTFQIMRGEVSGDPANPAATGHVEIVINPTTYNSGNTHRDNVVLRDALETRNYSMIRFVNTRIEDLEMEAPAAIGKATIVGNLTLHGMTREIRVPVEVTLSPDREFTASGDVTFDYTEFGVNVPHALFALPAGKEVDIKFRILATLTNTSSTPPPPAP
jgi:polyisoprenoid-binding protein YceI